MDTRTVRQTSIAMPRRSRGKERHLANTGCSSALVVLLSTLSLLACTPFAQDVPYCYFELRLWSAAEGERFVCDEAKEIATAAYLNDAGIVSRFECQSLQHKEDLILRARIR